MSPPIDLDGIKARLAAIGSPAEESVVYGRHTEDDGTYEIWRASETDPASRHVCRVLDEAHADLIAHATSDIAALVAEVERLRAEVDERAVEMDRLRDELDRADPHAMTLLEQAVDRLEAERQAILDAGGDALWAGGAKTLPEAVAGVLHALDVALTRSAKVRGARAD